MKDLFWSIIFTTLFIFSVVDGMLRLSSSLEKSAEHEYTGVVLSKSADEVQIKHGTRTDLYLLMQFDNRTRAIEVSPTTYLSSQVGEELIFNLDYEEMNGRAPNRYSNLFLEISTLILSYLSIVILVIYSCILLVKLINLTFDGNLFNRQEFMKCIYFTEW